MFWSALASFLQFSSFHSSHIFCMSMSHEIQTNCEERLTERCLTCLSSSMECTRHWGFDSPFIAWLAGYVCRCWVRKGVWRYFLSLRFSFFSSDLWWVHLNLPLLPTSFVFSRLGLISHFPRSFSGLCISWPRIPCYNQGDSAAKSFLGGHTFLLLGALVAAEVMVLPNLFLDNALPLFQVL